MYLIVLETINQGTREHRCRYGHHKIKIEKKSRKEFSELIRQFCIYFLYMTNEMKCHVDFRGA